MAIGLKPPCDAGAIAACRAGRAAQPASGAWIIAASIMASSMVFIDTSSVNLALPVLQTQLHANNAQAQWVVEIYALFLSALILLGGALGDAFGRKRIFLWGVACFAVASALCGISQSVSGLIAARGVQGVASALLTPGSLSILGASFDEQRRGKAIGAWSSFTTMTSVAGPLIGGLILQHASWRWIFFINIPLAIGCAAITMLHVPESRDEAEARHVDWIGALLATVGLGAVVFSLISAGLSGWSPALVGCLVAGIVLLGLFAFAEARVKEPMMPLSLFANRNFSAVNLQTLLLYAALGGATFLLPFNLILIQHYSPTQAGAAFLPFVVLVALLSPWVGAMVHSIGPKLPLVAGSLIAALALASLSLPAVGGSYWSTFFGPTLGLGLGMALVITPLTTTVMDSVEHHRFGLASGVNNAVARTASLIAVALFSLTVAGAFNRQLDHQLKALHVPVSAVRAIDAQRPNLGAAKAPGALSAELRRSVQNAFATSYVSGFRTAMLLAGTSALAGALLAALLITNKRL